MTTSTDSRQIRYLEGTLLSEGAHATPEEGLCLMEAVAYLAGEPHSDSPACTCPVLAAYVRVVNDGGWESDEARTAAMLPLAGDLIGTGTDRPGALQNRFRILAMGTAREVVAPLLDGINRTYAGELRNLSDDTAWQDLADTCDDILDYLDEGFSDSGNVVDAVTTLADAADWAFRTKWEDPDTRTDLIRICLLKAESLAEIATGYGNLTVAVDILRGACGVR